MVESNVCLLAFRYGNYKHIENDDICLGIFLSFFFVGSHSIVFNLNINRPDVWMLTTTQALTWITDPKPLKVINSKYDAWDCEKKPNNVQKPCNLSNKCALPFKTQTSNVTDTRYMETCKDCPNQYPWLGKTPTIRLRFHC